MIYWGEDIKEEDGVSGLPKMLSGSITYWDELTREID